MLFLAAVETGDGIVTAFGSENERRLIGDCVRTLQFFGSSLIVSSRVLRLGITFLLLSSASG